MPYTKSVIASVTDRIDMLSDAWDVLKKISVEDSTVQVGMTSINPSDRRWYSGKVNEWDSKNKLRIMSLERKENHVRVLVNGDDSFFWKVVEIFEPVYREYHASYEIIKVGEKVIKNMDGEYSNWKERNARMEKIRKEEEKKRFIAETTVAAIVSAIAAVVTTLAIYMR